MSYEDFLTERILAPLGLNSTGSVIPEEAKGVIPKGDFWFGTDTGFETPYVVLPFGLLSYHPSSLHHLP